MEQNVAVDQRPRPKFLAPIHSDGWIFIGGALVITLILAWTSGFFGWIGMIVTAWMAYFFRNPERVTPTREDLVVSPADGVVQSVVTSQPPKELDLGKGTWTRVSIFLNIFDVHVNRIPITGNILKSSYRPGKFFNASLDKASEYNERHSLAVETKDKKVVGFVQIAGLLARRIRCDVKEGQKVMAGQRYGIIRFGSRVDIYLPKGIAPLVIEGQRMIGGETIIADLTSKEAARKGGVR